MKAAVYADIQKIRFEDRPVPGAGPGQAVVKIKYCGLCGTDMHLYWNGDPVVKPGHLVLGHENVGVITELGAGVNNWKLGERVVIAPPGPCGRCYFCLHGHSNICVKSFPNTNGLGVDGGMAEYMHVGDPDGMFHRIPDNVTWEDAVLCDILCTSYRGIYVSEFKMGDNVVVSGAGPIGLSAIIFLKMAGARHITALQRSAQRRELARQMGADLVLDPVAEGAGLAGKIRSLYGGIGADVVIEAAGTPQSLEMCLTLSRAGGQVLNLGVAGEPATVIQALMVVNELSMKSSLAYTGEEVDKVLYYMSAGKISTRGLFSGVIPMADVVEKGFNGLKKDKALIKLAIAP